MRARSRKLPTSEAAGDIADVVRTGFGTLMAEGVALRVVGNPEILRGLRRYRVPGVGTTFYDRADVYYEAVVSGVRLT